MKGNKRKNIAIIAGILTFFIFGLIAFFCSYGIAALAELLSSKNTKQAFQKWGYDFNKDVSNFYIFYCLGLIFAISLTVTYIIWDFKDSIRRRLFIYVPFMLLIINFSIYNYTHGDYLVQPDIQIIFNFILIFLTLVCVIKFWTLRAKSIDGQILKYIILFLLLIFGLFTPLTFSFYWLIEWLGLSKVNFNMSIITAITGIATTIITVLKYRDDKKKDKISTAHSLHSET